MNIFQRAEFCSRADAQMLSRGIDLAFRQMFEARARPPIAVAAHVAHLPKLSPRSKDSYVCAGCRHGTCAQELSDKAVAWCNLHEERRAVFKVIRTPSKIETLNSSSLAGAHFLLEDFYLRFTETLCCSSCHLPRLRQLHTSTPATSSCA